MTRLDSLWRCIKLVVIRCNSPGQAMDNSSSRFQTFAEFYPFYLLEHQQPLCRALHYIGSSLVVALLIYMVITGAWSLAWALLVLGYGFAWIGHFFVEHNKPATFKYPIYSLMADWVMLKDFLTGQLATKLAAAKADRAAC